MNRLGGGCALAGALAAVAVRSDALAGQMPPARPVPIARAECGAAMAERLRIAHPMGAAADAGPLCGVAGAWVPTAPLGFEQRRIWDRALDRLARAGEACRMAAATVARMERAGVVSVWQAPDTVGGVVYHGATYLGPALEPVAMQFWAGTFDRPLAWVAAALAHEGFHALDPPATEAEALRFGERCGGEAERRAPPVIAVQVPAAARALWR